MPRRVAVVLAVVLLAVCGVVHGRWTDRWQTSSDLEEAAARIEQVPLTVGAWRGDAVEVDARSFAQAGAQAYWARVYKKARTRQSALAILMCGRAGRMAIHTPEMCYGGAGYEMHDQPAPTPMRSSAGADLGEFFTARFTKATGLGSDLRLYWGWNPGEGWRAEPALGISRPDVPLQAVRFPRSIRVPGPGCIGRPAAELAAGIATDAAAEHK